MTSAPDFDEDLFSDAVIRNPWPVYARMRELGPVVRVTRLGNYALPRHNEVQQVLRDHDTFISSQGVAADQFGCDLLQGNTVASDGERHRLLRKAIAQPILPGSLDDVRSKVQDAADQLIEQLLEKESFDVVQDLAQYLPFSIVRDLIGLPEFGQDKMLQWAGAAFDVLGVQNQRGMDALPVIDEMREFIGRDATRDKLKPGSWTHRIHELVDSGQMPAECAAFAIRDYINPSLDTTISATAEMIKQLAINPGQWERLKQEPHLIGNAVNEAVRLGSPIRSFSRHASKDTEIAGIPIAAGSRVMMLFASANRDETKFNDADKFDVARSNQDHVGFGSGVHMCVGMHLAQLEMQALLNAMIPRVADISIGKPTVKLNNIICAYESLPCHFTVESRTISLPVKSLDLQPGERLRARVSARRKVAENIDCFELTPMEGTSFPAAAAGAHIDLHLAPELIRQYSLTGDIGANFDRKLYQIAVQKAVDSKGGSERVHEALVVGAEIELGKPRNHFPLVDSSEPVVLVAGGIGITPLLAMAWTLHHHQREFEFHVCVQNHARLPFGNEFSGWPFKDKLRIYSDDRSDDRATRGSGFDLKSLVKKRSSAQLYVCGPTGFMEKVVRDAIDAGLNKNNIHQEHFSAQVSAEGAPFTLIASRSQRTFEVPRDKTALQVLTDAGIKVETSCEHGVCGSCLTPVLLGIPDHRDSVQTDAEKAGNQRFAVCCSRSNSQTLVIDI